MNKKKLSHSNLNSSITSVLAALLCIVIGMAVGFLVLLAINPGPRMGRRLCPASLRAASMTPPYGVGKELANAAPLIMTGLSVAFAFKTGLFNIGAAGQYTLGAYGALYCAIMLKMPWYRLPDRRHHPRRHLGRYPRLLQGLLQHQRGHHLHHVQLDRPVSGQ